MAAGLEGTPSSLRGAASAETAQVTKTDMDGGPKQVVTDWQGVELEVRAVVATPISRLDHLFLPITVAAFITSITA